MRVRLKNFRCYIDETFDFGKEGITLLSGVSGRGKSSVLMGIYFALFGVGSKVTAYGKTSCSVELEFDGIKVVRTKRPNRVVVNDVYEDDSAQEIINKKFGDTFNVTGFIAQNALNSFILMSAVDKLCFLEKFAFKDVDLAKIKGRCKAHISKQHDELLSIVSQLDMAKKIFEEIEIPNEVKFPLKCSKNQREKVIKNENIKLKNCHTIIRRLNNNKNALNTEINDLKVLEATIQSRKETYDSIVIKLKDIREDLENETYEGDEIVEKYEKSLKNILRHRELFTLKKQVEEDEKKLSEMYNEEKLQITEKIGGINSSLWKEHSKSEITNTVFELKQCLKDLERIESLRKDLKHYKIDEKEHEENKNKMKDCMVNLEEKQNLCVKLVFQQELYSCPSCHTKLCVKNKELCIINEGDIETDKNNLKEVENEIISLKKVIKKLQGKNSENENKICYKVKIEKELKTMLDSFDTVPKIEEVKEDIEYLISYQIEQNENEKRKEKLEIRLSNEEFSSSYLRFKSSVKNRKEKIKLLTESSESYEKNENDDEEEIRKKIIEQKQIKQKKYSLTEQFDILEKEKSKCENILKNTRDKHIEKYKNINVIDELYEKMSEKNNEIKEYEIKKNNHEKNLKQIEHWEQYQKELNNYETWETKVEDLSKKEKETKKEYAAATELKDKILEAESIAMINIIESINTHARVYLDAFFTDNPICVQLQPFKETKKNTKPQINIEIEYKGMEADMTMLSGGELSRVILAYTLALAEMFNTPLLLLDECTASLDQELTSTVFEAIRENFNGKLIIIIAHQVITGTFDKIIKLP